MIFSYLINIQSVASLAKHMAGIVQASLGCPQAMHARCIVWQLLFNKTLNLTFFVVNTGETYNDMTLRTVWPKLTESLRCCNIRQHQCVSHSEKEHII